MITLYHGSNVDIQEINLAALNEAKILDVASI